MTHSFSVEYGDKGCHVTYSPPPGPKTPEVSPPMCYAVSAAAPLCCECGTAPVPPPKCCKPKEKSQPPVCCVTPRLPPVPVKLPLCCAEPLPPCCPKPTVGHPCVPTNIKYVMPCYRYDDGRIVGQLPASAFKRNGMQDQHFPSRSGICHYMNRCRKDVVVEMTEACEPLVCSRAQ